MPSPWVKGLKRCPLTRFKATATVMKQPNRILVIKFRHIGDVLLTAPLISTLKLGIQGARVCAVVKPGTEAMLEGHSELDQLYVLPTRQKSESVIVFFKRTLPPCVRIVVASI